MGSPEVSTHQEELEEGEDITTEAVKGKGRKVERGELDLREEVGFSWQRHAPRAYEVKI